jgi:hypothetical protein
MEVPELPKWLDKRVNDDMRRVTNEFMTGYRVCGVFLFPRSCIKQ